MYEERKRALAASANCNVARTRLRQPPPAQCHSKNSKTCSALLIACFVARHALCGSQGSIGLPDVHSGYGFAIGNVAAFDIADPDAVVSPGAGLYAIALETSACLILATP